MRLPYLYLIFGATLVLACHPTPPPEPKTSDALPTDKIPDAKASPIFTPEQGAKVASEEVPLLEQINHENAKVATAALPSLVRISSSLPIDGHMEFMGKELPFKVPTPPRHGFEDQNMAFGSGIIISNDGYIVTNNHVVEGAKNMKVELYDKRIFPATLIASDKDIDVAILKINAKELIPLPWADSDKVEVGDQVYAIGNPFNLGASVSKGIISASSRSLPDPGNYADYIQTDASINPGNSGGALVDIHGQLVGINVVIASTTGVSRGVGFAIPSNLLRYAVQGLMKEGHLARGYLGVRLPTMVDDGVMPQLGLDDTEGALVSGVTPGSPADAAKLQPADFITAIDGRKVASVDELRLVVAQIPAGTEAALKFIRTGTSHETKVKMGLFPEMPPGSGPQVSVPDSSFAVAKKDSFTANNVLGGLQVMDLNDEARLHYRVKPWVRQGAVVTAVEEGSAAEARGFEPGNVIELVCVKRALLQKVTGAKDVVDLTKSLKTDQSVAMLVDHDFSSSFIYLSPSK